jgi:succinate dehydrogenase/fumarate reductase flavoprotein subunit
VLDSGTGAARFRAAIAATEAGTEVVMTWSRPQWEDRGVVCNAGRLEHGLSPIAELSEASSRIDVPPMEEASVAELAEAFHLRADPLTADSTTRSALARCESRGPHFRAGVPSRTRARW